MKFISMINRLALGGSLVLAGAAFVAGGASDALAKTCKNHGKLDARYCDDNGDLVADTPTDKSKWLNPSTLVFSYTPVEDPSVYENVFTEFLTHIEKVTGKHVKWRSEEHTSELQ